jgi:hypothetical protein
MRRRDLIAFVGAASVLASFAAVAQQPSAFLLSDLPPRSAFGGSFNKICASSVTLREETFGSSPLLYRVSDAGRMRGVAAYSAAGVRKPPRKETALRELRAVPRALWGFERRG